MNSFPRQCDIAVVTHGAPSPQLSETFFDCQGSKMLNLELGKHSKNALNLLKSKADLRSNSIKPAPSVIILKHCKELFDNHSLRKPSIWGKEPLLSAEDVKLLRHIIESNERYRCLKEEDSALLKEILINQMSEVESQQKFLWRLLKILQYKRRNALQKRILETNAENKPTKVLSDTAVVQKKKTIEKRKCLTDRDESKILHSRPFERSQSISKYDFHKVKYVGYLQYVEIAKFKSTFWRMAVVGFRCKEYELRCSIFEDQEEPSSEISPQLYGMEIVEAGKNFTNFFKIAITGRTPHSLIEKLIKILRKDNEQYLHKGSQMMSLKYKNFRKRTRSTGPAAIEKIMSREPLKNCIVFLVHFVLFAILVLSLTSVDFQCNE